MGDTHTREVWEWRLFDVLWVLWLHHNKVTFKGSAVSVDCVVDSLGWGCLCHGGLEGHEWGEGDLGTVHLCILQGYNL